MVLDNADDADVLFSVEDATGTNIPPKTLASCLPQSNNDRILITTRDRRIGEQLGIKEGILDVQLLDSSEASLLLRSRVHKNHWNEAQVQDLTRALGYLPLALTQAAAFINQNNIYMAEYCRCLHASDNDLQDFPRSSIATRGGMTMLKFRSCRHGRFRLILSRGRSRVQWRSSH